ncbi:MAG: hypothetical protein ACOYXU_01960 [Nitrospirota bacterium]
MNKFTLFYEEFRADDRLSLHGINFSNCIVVRLVVDGVLLHEEKGFEDSLLYFSELQRSSLGAGRYLIFTCACGIAEDGGWDGIVVCHDSNSVSWEFSVGDVRYTYRFDRNEYLDEIESMSVFLKDAGLHIEPSNVVFPENMSGPQKADEVV